MAPACSSSTRARTLASDHQRVEGPKNQFFEEQDTLQESIFRRHQETLRNTGRARQKNRRRGDKVKNATTQDR